MKIMFRCAVDFLGFLWVSHIRDLFARSQKKFKKFNFSNSENWKNWTFLKCKAKVTCKKLDFLILKFQESV